MKKVVYTPDIFRAKDLFKILIISLTCVFIFVLLFRVFFAIDIVSGSSMEPTFNDGDILILNRLAYINNKPERYDIIVFDVDGSEDSYVKRVMGLPGERIVIKEGRVFVNDKELDEYYGKDLYIKNGYDASNEVKIDRESYFCIGDNRNNSTDSRKSSVGNINKDKFIGKAILRIWPLSAFGSLDKQ